MDLHTLMSLDVDDSEESDMEYKVAKEASHPKVAQSMSSIASSSKGTRFIV